jgi:formylglycine-generating enzyme required for sulfatase activity
MAVTGRRTTSPRAVAGLQPNAWGLYDMHGNVAEWTSSWYGVYPGGTVNDYAGPRDGRVRVFRGGSYDSPARNARSAYRGWVSGSTAAPNRGLRVVLAPRL